MTKFWGGHFPDAAAGGSSSAPVYTGTTTADLIRDRMIALVIALTPVKLPRFRFTAFQNEWDADFQTWAEARAEGAMRVFQIRDVGADISPTVSNTDVIEDHVTFVVLVAYPQTHFAGKQNALDRDKVMNQDQHQIEQTIGMNGYANFAGPAPIPNASWLPDGYRVERRKGNGVDFLAITETYRFLRSTP